MKKIAFKHSFFQIFSFRAYLPVEVHLRQQGSDRGGPCGSEATVLYISRHRDLRIVLRCEAYEDRMVVTVRVLRRTCLSADVKTFDRRYAGRTAGTETAVHRTVHAADHFLEMHGVHHRIVFLVVFVVYLDMF